MSHHCIPKKLRFDVVYGPTASLGRTFSVMIKTATSHTANVTINLLKTKFGERVISRNGPVGWPPCVVVRFDAIGLFPIGRFIHEKSQKMGSASGLLQACP